jgi:mRNA-degrading endonuclease toxin of MazEF toxin-antitoxin module
MRAEDIKEGHIYYVRFPLNRKGEFKDPHLGLVLQRTVTDITFITVPLTRSSDESNKIKLDITELLPPHLRTKPTYAVYDNVITLNASRFENLFEKNADGKTEIYDVKVPDAIMDQVLEAVIKCLTKGLEKSRQKKILDNFKVENTNES